MQQHTHASLAKTERRRNLPVIGAFDVRQPHQLSLLRPQLFEQPRHVQSQYQVGTHAFRVARAALRCFSLALLLAPVVVNEIAGGPKQVRTQLPRIVDRRWRPKESQIRLLYDVVRTRRAADDARDIRAQRRCRPSVQRLEARFIDHERSSVPPRTSPAFGRPRTMPRPTASARRRATA